MQNQGFENSVVQEVNDFAVHDFINDSNFDQFIDLIRGENAIPITNYVPNYDADELMFGGEIIDSQFFPHALENVFNCSSISPPEHNLFLHSLPAFSGGDIDIGDGDNDNDEDDSSANTTTPTKGARGDRSRTLVSERRRRSRMKEKLYALRSLVPNITKMDKASIVGDAVSYVQELQMQAKKIKAEIAVLEESLTGAGKIQGLLENEKKPNTIATNQMRNSICRKILQMDVFQMEDKEYYVRLVSNKGEGMATSLYKALESLSSFDVKNSNFSTVSERCVLACTVNVKECGEDMNLSTLKLWVTGALLNQGFEIRTF
ncbi:hypothetical protein AQUCO_01900196v1 [Aquilegia coerulea]|uniref:BHLH domain-containing protein n=1 Tax=Aquilegia coerulea TaxID=218851 RepID=A0A2G5DJC8_AQUCA|nr:hypothetical protein AQUCO_01900196v1 [Aquilegia coerulea]